MEQKDEMQYKGQFTEREYAVLLLRDQHRKTYREIGDKLKISASRVMQIYQKAKLRQIMLYLQAIGKDEGNERRKLNSLALSLSQKYGSRVYAAAYLEKEYEDILTEFRDGEPSSSHECVDLNPDYYRQATIKDSYSCEISEEDRETHEIEDIGGYKSKILYRTKLNKFEQLVLQERGKGFQAIAGQLNITKDLVRNIYMDACHVLLHMKFAVIKEKTGKTFRELHREIDSQDIQFYQYQKQIRYIEEAYRDVLTESDK